MSPKSDATTSTPLESPKPTPQCAQLEITPIVNPIYTPWNLPDLLMAQLQEWHENYPSEKPPFVCGRTPDVSKPWKVVDCSYRAVDTQKFMISKQTKQRMDYYFVLALRLPDGPARFFRSYQRSFRGTYLYAWLGVSQGFEREPCAVRRLGRTLDTIESPPGIWDHVPDVDFNHVLHERIWPSLSSVHPPESEYEPPRTQRATKSRSPKDARAPD